MKSTVTTTGFTVIFSTSLLAWVPGALADSSVFTSRSVFPANQDTSHIVVTIGDPDANNLCGNRFNLSNLGIGDGFDFPKPGGSLNSFEFPRPSGVSSSFGYPAPIGSATSFQLPQSSQNPDIIGCVDNQRNILFINIRPRVIQEKVVLPPANPPVTPPPPTPPAPQPTPTPTPIPMPTPTLTPNGNSNPGRPPTIYGIPSTYNPNFNPNFNSNGSSNNGTTPNIIR